MLYDLMRVNDYNIFGITPEQIKQLDACTLIVYTTVRGRVIGFHAY